MRLFVRALHMAGRARHILARGILSPQMPVTMLGHLECRPRKFWRFGGPKHWKFDENEYGEPTPHKEKCDRTKNGPPQALGAFFFFFFFRPIFFFFLLKCALRVVWWAPEAVAMLARMCWTPSCPIPSTFAAGWPSGVGQPLICRRTRPRGGPAILAIFGVSKTVNLLGKCSILMGNFWKVGAPKGLCGESTNLPSFQPTSAHKKNPKHSKHLESCRARLKKKKKNALEASQRFFFNSDEPQQHP